MIENAIYFVGGTSVLIAAVAWLGRQIIKFILDKDVAKFKSDLEKTTAVSLKQLEHDLSLKYKEQSLLKEKRIEVIEGLYSQLVDFVSASHNLVRFWEFENDTPKSERANALAVKFELFQKTFLYNEFYFNEDIAEQVKSIRTLLVKAGVKFTTYHLGDPNQLSEIPPIQRHDAWVEANRIIEEEVKVLMTKIRDEFRKLVGVTK